MSNDDTQDAEFQTAATQAPREQKLPIAAGAQVAAIVPRDLGEVFRLAQYVHAAKLTPRGMETVEQITIAIMKGLELGIPPMAAIQGIAIINNRACVWGDLLLALVRRSREMVYVREWMEGEGDDRVAYCETLRVADKEPVRRSFSVRDAMQARLWTTEERVTRKGRDGSYEKDNDSPWFKYPQRMLQMRARAWCLRDVYPDITGGMPTREEVEDEFTLDASEVRDVTPATTGLAERLRDSRRPVAENAGGPAPVAAIAAGASPVVAAGGGELAAETVAARLAAAADTTAPAAAQPVAKPRPRRPATTSGGPANSSGATTPTTRGAPAEGDALVAEIEEALRNAASEPEWRALVEEYEGATEAAPPAIKERIVDIIAATHERFERGAQARMKL